jgi:hypothetical protein
MLNREIQVLESDIERHREELEIVKKDKHL